MKKALSPSRRLTMLFAMLALTAGLMRLESVTFNPLQSLMGSPQTWYLDVTYAAKPTTINAAFVTIPLESQIRLIKGVKKTYGVTFSNRSVLAFVTDAQTSPETVRSEIEFLLSKVQTQQPEEKLHHLLFHKDSNRTLKRVIPIDRQYGIRPEDPAHFENEFIQLFGDEGVFDPEVGFLPLMRPNISITLAESTSALRETANASTALENLSRLLTKISEVQLGYFRRVPLRFIDLQYSSQDLLQLGLTGSDLRERLTSRLEETPPSNLRKAAESYAVSRTPIIDLPTLLESEVSGSGPSAIKLSDLVLPRPQHLMVSGLLGRTGAEGWLIEPLRTGAPARRGKDSGPNEEPALTEIGIEIVTSQPSANVEVIRALREALREGDGMKGWQIMGFTDHDASQTSAEHTSSDQETLTGVALFAVIFSMLLPLAAPGVFLLRSFSLSLVVFSAGVWITGLSLTQEILATALGLMFVYHFSTQLPVSRRLFLKTSKPVSSEKIHYFLFLMTLPVLFTLAVFGPQFDAEDREHILSFCLACSAVFFSSVAYRHSPSAHDRAYDEEFSRPAALLKGLVCLIPFCFVLYEPKVFRHSPPALAISATVEVNGEGGRSNEETHQLRARLASLRQAGFQSVYLAAGESKQIVSVLEPEIRRSGLRPDFVERLLKGLTDGATALISPEARSPELSYFRLVDRDQNPLSTGIHGHRKAAETKQWFNSLQVPGDVLFAEETQKTLAQVPLSTVLLTEVQQTLSKTIHNKGREVLLFAAYGDTVGPAESAKISGGVVSALTSTLTGAGVKEEHMHLRSNVERHAHQRDASYSLNILISLLVSFSGALFFGTLRGAIQTVATYFLCYGISKPVFLFVYIFSGSILNVSELHIQTASIAISLALLSIWAHISADLNTSRKANLPLEKAIVPFFIESRYLYRWLLVLWSFAMVLSLSFYSFRFIAGVLLVSTLALVLVPGWVYSWVVLEELYHRRVLRISVLVAQRFRLSSRALMLALLTTLTTQVVSPKEARSDDIFDTGCSKAGFVVLPFHVRPFSMERATLDTRVTEFLSSQLPCAKIAYDLTPEVAEIMRSSTGVKGHSLAKSKLSELIKARRKEIESLYQKERATSRSALKVHILAGFVEELIGHTGVVVLHDFGGEHATEFKFTERNAEMIALLKRLALNIRNEDGSLLDTIDPGSQLIAVEIEPIERGFEQGQSGITERIRNDLDNFIRSRFTHPLPPDFLERKNFFRIAQPGESPRYKVKITFESGRARLYATVRAARGNAARSTWIEEDLVNIGEFHNRVLNGTRSALADLEGINDYSLNGGLSILGNRNGLASLFSVNFRQNLGSLALAARLRLGNGDSFAEESVEVTGRKVTRQQNLILAGAAVGYQIADLRWISLDAGLAIDGGLSQYDRLSTGEKTTTDPNLLLSAGPYVQTLATVRGGVSFLLRFGLEQPYESPLGEQSTDSGLLPVAIDTTAGVGFAF